MGIEKINVPTRFDLETIVDLDRERAWHKMTRSQYVRESMKKWFRMVTAGTVSLLDLPMQEEQRNFCEQREHYDEFSQRGREASACPGAKPLSRPTRSPRALRVTRYAGMEMAWGTSLPFNSTRLLWGAR